MAACCLWPAGVKSFALVIKAILVSIVGSATCLTVVYGQLMSNPFALMIKAILAPIVGLATCLSVVHGHMISKFALLIRAILALLTGLVTCHSKKQCAPALNAGIQALRYLPIFSPPAERLPRMRALVCLQATAAVFASEAPAWGLS